MWSHARSHRNESLHLVTSGKEHDPESETFFSFFYLVSFPSTCPQPIVSGIVFSPKQVGCLPFLFFSLLLLLGKRAKAKIYDTSCTVRACVAGHSDAHFTAATRSALMNTRNEGAQVKKKKREEKKAKEAVKRAVRNVSRLHPAGWGAP